MSAATMSCSSFVIRSKGCSQNFLLRFSVNDEVFGPKGRPCHIYYRAVSPLATIWNDLMADDRKYTSSISLFLAPSSLAELPCQTIITSVLRTDLGGGLTRRLTDGRAPISQLRFQDLITSAAIPTQLRSTCGGLSKGPVPAIVRPLFLRLPITRCAKKLDQGLSRPPVSPPYEKA